MVRVQGWINRSTAAEGARLRMRSRRGLQPDPSKRALLPTQHRQGSLQLRRQQLFPEKPPTIHRLRLRRRRHRHLLRS